MRVSRLSIVTLLAFFVLLLVAAAPAGAATAQTYRVLVGAERAHRGVDIMAFFPHKLTVHVGDTVHWKQNSNEIHTVTFLGGQSIPELVVPAASLGLPEMPSPMVLNPKAVDRVAATGGLSDPGVFVNSGLMGREPGQYRSFDVTFTRQGTYEYLCVVHGMMMSGTVNVVARDVAVPSPTKVNAIAHYQIARKLAKVPAVVKEAKGQIQAPTQNADGTMTHVVSLGFGKGQIDLMRFFPRQVNLKAGDKVVWQMTTASDAPHTVTFLNGAAEPSLVVPVPQSSGPPVLYLNPDVLFPSMPTAELTRAGVYNAGFMLPVPGTTFELTVGDVTPGPLPYMCLLHNESGMKGRLVVLP